MSRPILDLGDPTRSNSDDTFRYGHCKFHGTLNELIKCVLERGEWGEIIHHGDTLIEYRRDKILLESPRMPDLLPLDVTGVVASGGWSCMDYYVELSGAEAKGETPETDLRSIRKQFEKDMRTPGTMEYHMQHVFETIVLLLKYLEENEECEIIQAFCPKGDDLFDE